jgi:hypothetical protein
LNSVEIRFIDSWPFGNSLEVLKPLTVGLVSHTSMIFGEKLFLKHLQRTLMVIERSHVGRIKMPLDPEVTRAAPLSTINNS